MRQDATGPFAEVLPANAFDLSAQSLPVLDSHNTATVRAIVGRTLSIRRDADLILAEMQLSAAEDVAPIGQRIADGTLRGISIGYRVAGWTTRREGGQRIKSATRVRLTEVTLTSNPADPNSGVRQEKEGDMPKDVQTEDRAALIQRCRTAHPTLTDEWGTRMEDAGGVLTDAEVIDDARETALTARQKRTAPTIRTAAPANDDPAETRTRQVEALACRMMGTAPSDAARPFMALGLHDLARDALATAGIAVRSLGAEELLTRAMHTTSDFPQMLTGAGNRVLANAYQAAQSPLKSLARQRTASDFRALSILKLGEFAGLQKVTEAGEIKAMTTGEAKESYALETFGGTFALSRKALINDDLGAFARWGEMMGRAAAETEAAQLLGLLSANGGAGVTLDDGAPLFHADHGNLAASGAALSEATLSAARLAMRTQKGLDGATPVNVVPKYLLVGPALETTAEKLLATISATTTNDVNPFGGRLSLLVEPRIVGNGWYVFGDPATAPVLEFSYLSSAPGPQLSSRDGWEVLGREFRVVLDFGCGAVDHRGAYRNAGA
ncbi:MAG: Mu-like prophage major head subunit gpT family protein [Pseudorhodobacter sp.]|nr:Mu-like prophage major head subunit gpT family protein [Pseudorhodobacter sp.]